MNAVALAAAVAGLLIGFSLGVWAMGVYISMQYLKEYDE